MSVATPGFAEVHRSRTFPAWRLKFLCKMFMCDPQSTYIQRNEDKADWGCVYNSSNGSLTYQSFLTSFSSFLFLMPTQTQHSEKKAGNRYLPPCFTQGLSKFLSKMFSTCATGISLPFGCMCTQSTTYEFRSQCTCFKNNATISTRSKL